MINNVSSLIQRPREEILNLIGEGYDSAKAISEKTGMSVAHISQQLQLLEAQGVIQKHIHREGKVGKPSANYSINQEFAITIIISKNGISKTRHKLTSRNQYMIQAASQEEEIDRYFLQKFYFTHEDIIHASKIVATLNTTEKDINLLIISDDVDRIRTEKSSVIMTHPDKSKKRIVIWSHTWDEVVEGLRHKEAYFVDKISQAQILVEQHKQFNLAKLKKMLLQSDSNGQ